MKTELIARLTAVIRYKTLLHLHVLISRNFAVDSFTFNLRWLRSSNSDGRGCLFERFSVRRFLIHIGEFAGTCILDSILYFKVKLKLTEHVNCSSKDTVRIVRQKLAFIWREHM